MCETPLLSSCHAHSVPFRTLRWNWRLRSSQRNPKKRRIYDSSTNSSGPLSDRPPTFVRSAAEAVHCKQRYTIISLSGEGDEYQANKVNLGPSPFKALKGFCPRFSSRWIPTISGLNIQKFQVPFYDMKGFQTGCSLGSWTCMPHQFISSCISTVFSRLNKHTRNHNPWRCVDAAESILTRAAIYYTLTNNTWFWDRVLVLSKDIKKNKNLIHRLTVRFTMKADENYRFVYSHACFQAKWLISRALRPRDKSFLKSPNKYPKQIQIMSRQLGLWACSTISRKIEGLA